MGTTWDDGAWELAHAEEEWQEVVENISQEAIVQFAEDRYTAYFKNNAQMHLPVLEILAESKILFKNQHFSASLVFSFIAVENILRELILRPLFWGTFIDEQVANMVTNSLLDNRLHQMSKFIFHFLDQSIGVDLRTVRRPNESTPLWPEIQELKELRNHTVHSWVKCDDKSATRALEIAEFLYDNVFLSILKAAAFEIDSSNRIIHKR
jgi:hypothetical protein